MNSAGPDQKPTGECAPLIADGTNPIRIVGVPADDVTDAIGRARLLPSPIGLVLNTR